MHKDIRLVGKQGGYATYEEEGYNIPDRKEKDRVYESQRIDFSGYLQRQGR